MAKIGFQRSIRFTKDEWDAVVEAAEMAGMTPGSFVRKAAARCGRRSLPLGGGLTLELAELIKRTFRGVHLLAFLRREELDESGRKDLFRRAAAVARAAQDKTLGADEPNASTRDTPPRTGFGVADA